MIDPDYDGASGRSVRIIGFPLVAYGIITERQHDRSLNGREVVPTVLPQAGAPYGNVGGRPDPAACTTLAAILDVFDRTGPSMYEAGIIPVALAHGKAAYPIVVRTDVLNLVGQAQTGSGAHALHSRNVRRRS